MSRGGYREADVARRVIEGEEARREAEERAAALEREVWALRRRMRATTAMGALPAGGVGSLAGTLLGAAGFLGLGNPFLLLGGATLGFFLGVILKGVWTTVDDGFPKAPPERRR